VHNVSWFGAFVTLLAKVFGLPVISKLPNSGEFGILGIRRRPFGYLHIALVKRSDAIIAMTPESVGELEDIGYPGARVLKVTNGIAVLPATSQAPTSVETVNAIYVGRLSSEKGLTDLLHSWRSVKAHYSPNQLSMLTRPAGEDCGPSPSRSTSAKQSIFRP
jgi:glycosyltransferase involved in cell wall biosynthesis